MRHRHEPFYLVTAIQAPCLTLMHEWLTSLPGDGRLLRGRPCVRSRMNWTLQNIHALGYTLTGDSIPGGSLWRWISNLGDGSRTSKYRL